MRLESLIHSMSLGNLKDIELRGIKLCPHNVQQGDLFVCLHDVSEDEAASEIQEALRRGASCIIKSDLKISLNLNNYPIVTTTNIRKLLSEVASKYYPSSIETVIGVTGTCGKTSTVSFIRQLLTSLEYNSGSLGTLGVWHGNDQMKQIPKVLTTSPIFLLYYISHFLCSRGVTHFAMEVTSHGLDRNRVDYIPFKVGLFTNFSLSHLDYHKNMSHYYAAKRRFFSDVLKENTVAVLNTEEDWFQDIISLTKKRNLHNILIGKDIRLEKSYIGDFETEVNINCFGEKKSFCIPFHSTFQTENILFAIGALMGIGINIDNILKQIPKLQPVEGRMELVKRLDNGAIVLLDFAHRPETFEKFLKPLKKQGKDIVLVFGCGGGHSKKRREALGQIAQKYARKVFVTDDNARDDDPAAIRKMILKGCPNAIEIADRKSAISTALNCLKSNDVCIIAGRGSDLVQVIENKRIEFCDKTEILNALTIMTPNN